MPGSTPHHTEKWRRCVEHVSEQGTADSPHAVCTATLGPSRLADDVTSNEPPKAVIGKPFKKRKE